MKCKNQQFGYMNGSKAKLEIGENQGELAASNATGKDLWISGFAPGAGEKP